MIKFIHIGDLHAGKVSYGRSRNDEAEHAINEIIDFVKKEPVDFILFAGDVFDQYNPNIEATRLIFGHLVKEVYSLKIPTIIIRGNHDSDSFLESFETLGKNSYIHIFSRLSENINNYVISIKEANIICIPYISQKFILKKAGSTKEYADKVEKFIGSVISQAPKNTFNILTTHVMVQGGIISKSEREASVSDFFAINLNNISDISNLDYVALGHLHKYQQVKAPTQAYYAGSCFQIDFNEEGQQKYFNFVVLEKQKAPKIDKQKFQLKNELKTFKLNSKELKSVKEQISNLKGYAKVVIEDTFENTKSLERELQTCEEISSKILNITCKSFENPNINVDIENIKEGLLDFYKEYYKEKYKEDMPQKVEQIFLELEQEIENPQNIFF